MNNNTKNTADSNNLNEIICETVKCEICGGSEYKTVASGFDYEYWTSRQEFTCVQCVSCGHFFLNPRPKKEYASLIYPSNYYTIAGRHGKKSSLIISSLKSWIVKRRLSFFKNDLRRPIHILEIGSGDCALLLSLKDAYPNLKCTGVDLKFSSEIKNECNGKNILLFEGAIEDIKLPEKQYDMVVMNQLIEHLWDPSSVLKKLWRSLKENGMISIETVNIKGYDRFFFRKSFWGGYYFPRHMNLFSFGSMDAILKKTGFEVVKHYSLLAPIIWTFSVHAFLARRPERKQSFPGRFFSDRNPLSLMIFTCIDLIAVFFHLTTSNQKVIARKKC